MKIDKLRARFFAVWFRHSDKSLLRGSCLSHRTQERRERRRRRRRGLPAVPQKWRRCLRGREGAMVPDSFFFSLALSLMLSRSHRVWQACWLTSSGRNFKIQPRLWFSFLKIFSGTFTTFTYCVLKMWKKCLTCISSCKPSKWEELLKF